MRAQHHLVAGDGEGARAVAIAVEVREAARKFGVFQLWLIVVLFFVVFLLSTFIVGHRFAPSSFGMVCGDMGVVLLILLRRLKVCRHCVGIWSCSGKVSCGVPSNEQISATGCPYVMSSPRERQRLELEA